MRNIWIIPFAISTVLLSAQIDSSLLIQDIRYLSSDSLQGRGNGSAGAEMARAFLLGRLQQIPEVEIMIDTFPFYNRVLKKQGVGINLLCKMAGSKNSNNYAVISAHYDHLGIKNEEIYNGADDNASGTAALLAMVRYFQANPPKHNLLFAFFDAEELGLKGANHFVHEPKVPFESIAFNINMDMISRNKDQTLNACGTNYFPKLKRPLEKLAQKGKRSLTFLHDKSDTDIDDWTYSSDHGEFYKKGIPFLYFGVEDHPDYHKTTDDFENIDPEFYYQTVQLITEVVRHIDRRLNKYALDIKK